ncbi:MAG: SDR family NAD(P)-dependent oxidoreductase [Clostridia bacterium]|nr:SDR family NAD(P)-dependent oxidoreductase [Clostridia bacterium]
MSIAVITGASSGIGREFAFKLRDMAGVREFWLIARNEERLGKVAEELGVPCKIISADLATKEGIEKYRAALTENKPEISFLVNAAGFGVFGSFDILSEDTVTDMIDVNIKATVLITHMSVPFMPRGGRIIELGSGSCFTPLPHFNIYSSSKVFVLHYTKSLNYELKPYGIRATCFCPGWVNTAFLPKSLDAPGAYVPKSMKPLLDTEKVVEGCVRASIKGKCMYVTNWYTKLQHLLFKLLPDCILSSLWLGMLKKNGEEENS